MILENIAEIKMGVNVAKEQREGGHFGYWVFSAKEYEIQKEFAKIQTDKQFKDEITQQGDLLFRLIYPNKIIYVNSSLKDLLVPSNFCIIRTKKDSNYEPRFIKWFLESQEAKAEILNYVSGTTIKTTKVRGLRKIEIPYAPNQEQIALLLEASQKQKQRIQEWLHLKEQWYDLQIKEQIGKADQTK